MSGERIPKWSYVIPRLEISIILGAFTLGEAYKKRQAEVFIDNRSSDGKYIGTNVAIREASGVNEPVNQAFRKLLEWKGLPLPPEGEKSPIGLPGTNVYHLDVKQGLVSRLRGYMGR